ncbi:hypothetical protein GKZ68_08175 [Hymenobacter sp. BRD128]|uniref:hypothetical protein n=1 Tax=Hymenobacter sp. BRD128 TaxID=2675878 RepID=UPI0015647818|nr:hypothetical protein [Hymenobacter sp. BRD128]QKG56608.1 hypothetical protein GKZ68_08175 [Hymenobacter sp. BRD128]
MIYRLRFPLLATVLFCLTSMAGCPNKVPAGQFTVVKGIVTSLRSGRPLPGALVALISANDYNLQNYDLIDTVHTDAQGAYTLSFTNKKGLYYGVDCGQLRGGSYKPYWQPHLDFPDSVVTPAGGFLRLGTKDVVIGQTNVVNFRPSPRRVWQVQVDTRTTGYQYLDFIEQYYSVPVGPADNQHRLVTIYQALPFTTAAPQNFYQTPGVLPKALFRRSASGTTGTTQDTVVQLAPITPLTGDTVKATLKFGH